MIRSDIEVRSDSSDRLMRASSPADKCETDFPCKHRSRRVASPEQTRATSGRPNWLVAQITCFSSQLSALFADLVRSAAHWCIDPRLLAGARPVTTEEEEESCVPVCCVPVVWTCRVQLLCAATTDLSLARWQCGPCALWSTSGAHHRNQFGLPRPNSRCSRLSAQYTVQTTCGHGEC